MNKNTLLTNILVIVCFSSVFVNAQTDPNNWDKLNLSSTTIAGTKVYYEKSFEPNLPFFEEIYKKFLAQKDSGNAYELKKDQILADINKILGINEPDSKFQNAMWEQLIGIYTRIDITTICLAKNSTIVDFLSEGGELPYFTYDKNNDEVSYNPMIEGNVEDIANTGYELAFPIKSEQTFDKTVINLFKIYYQTFGKDRLDMAVHEISELSLFKYILPKQPYWRWFSDGTANAVTYEILKKYGDPELTEFFIKEFDTTKFSDLKNQLNLRYWMTGKTCILLADVPTEQGEKFSLARYAYSTFEIRRLIEEYGIDCISKIVNEIKVKESRDGNNLLETIKNVTGEDMDARLATYQDFNEPKDGIIKYENNIKKASQEKDYAQKLFNRLRRYEILMLSEDPTILTNEFRAAAVDLHRTGHEQEADETMNNLLEILSKTTISNVREVGFENLCLYALECEKPLKAREAAEELLKTIPDNVAALTIKAIVFIEERKLDQAKESATKIISLSKQNSLYYQIASQILAIDPNQVK